MKQQKRQQSATAYRMPIKRAEKRIACPIGCPQTFIQRRPQDVQKHLYWKHPETRTGIGQGVTLAPRKPAKPTAPTTTTNIQLPVAQVNMAAPVPVPTSGAHNHVSAALQELQARKQHIAQELGRMQDLQTENGMIDGQIAALQTAMAAFAIAAFGEPPN